MLQPSGTFIAQQCGQQAVAPTEGAPEIVSVCVGYVVGSQSKAVQFRLSDDSVHLFQVTAQSDLFIALMSGNTVSIFHLVSATGEEGALKAILSRDGTVQSLCGQFQGADFKVPRLQTMMTIM